VAGAVPRQEQQLASAQPALDDAARRRAEGRGLVQVLLHLHAGQFVQAGTADDREHVLWMCWKCCAGILHVR